MTITSTLDPVPERRTSPRFQQPHDRNGHGRAEVPITAERRREPMPTLRVLAWDHPRALLPLAAAARAWRVETGGELEIQHRSLAAFGDDVPNGAGADLILIDHPHIGEAVERGRLIALDDAVAHAELRAVLLTSIGPSGASYHHRGATWALPVDASCHGMATAHTVEPPRTLGDLVSAGDRLRVAVPLHPAHAISAHITLSASLGVPTVADAFSRTSHVLEALEVLGELAARGPGQAFDWEPPQALAAVESGSVDCVPFVYGYVGYDVHWSDVPVASQVGAPRPILGGVGMAIDSDCDDLAAAAAFALWFASPRVQRDVVYVHGGQPAWAGAWVTFREVETDPVFRGTARGMVNAVVRPRDAGWPAFQTEAGAMLVRGFRERKPAAWILDRLEELALRHGIGATA